ncbi:efflux RND transporter periplasmic adaptor subunit [Ponticaulis profundi]|uniref:Efflux RND transporter periplasmic adaptor subunit n=1 Tax=Ponticaulis profundi TaxID=2665222 RepID=A0ABW1SB98_9PROT
MSKTGSAILAVGLPVAILGVLGFGGFIALGALKPKPEKAAEAPLGLAVFYEPVKQLDLQLTVSSQGEVRPRREISISPQISGRVSSVSPSFIDGAFVRQGEILFRIEDADYQLARIRAQSQVASAEQGLVREQAESDIARRDWEELGTGDPSPLALREPQLAEARASLEAAKAQLRDAELALERTIIRAPFDGRVRTKEVDLGQYVSPGQELGRIFGTDIAEVTLPLNDDELGRLGLSLAFEESADNRGPAVTFTTNVAGQPRTWKGRVTRTSAAVDPATRLVSAIATVDDPFGEGADGDAPLAPGLFVSAEIEGQMLHDVLMAPRPALRKRDQIFIANPDDSTMSIRTVDVVYTSPEGVYVRSGVEAGEYAITSPIQAPFDGMKINIGGQASSANTVADTTDEQS